MKGRIVDILMKSNGVVSGEALSKILGVTRVAVWKHIRKLRELGYAIDAGPTGYQLQQKPDGLFPWEFPKLKDRFHFLAETASTMDAARRLAHQGCPDFTVVAAERQTAGRGRLNRTWLSESGGIYVTVVLRPEMPLHQAPLIGFGAAVAMTRVLNRLYGIGARVKWPNDILVSERKICGILCEMESVGQNVHFVNVGVGLNVFNDPSAVENKATALIHWAAPEVIVRRRLLRAFFDELAHCAYKTPQEQVVASWKMLTVTLGRTVRVDTGRDVLTGTARDVDENGSLILEKADGSVQTIFYGDCFHVESSHE